MDGCMDGYIWSTRELDRMATSRELGRLASEPPGFPAANFRRNVNRVAPARLPLRQNYLFFPSLPSLSFLSFSIPLSLSPAACSH